MLVHGWDLSRAVSRPLQDVNDLAERALPVVRAIYGALPRTEGGSFAPPSAPDADATALDHLAAYLGRRVD
jgi:hypothetical protein